MALGRSFERATGVWAGNLSVFTMYILYYYNYDGLTWPVIFNAMEIIVALRMSTMILIVGVGFYHEVKVVFKRFANIFSI